MAELPEITAVKVLTVKPGDRIVVLVDLDLDAATGNLIGEQVSRILQVTSPVLVLPRGFDVEVVREEQP